MTIEKVGSSVSVSTDDGTVQDIRSGSITMLEIIRVDYQVTPNSAQMSATLKTLLGEIHLGPLPLSPDHPTGTVSGRMSGYKAEVEATFNFSTYLLTLSGVACDPDLGCHSGHQTFQC